MKQRLILLFSGFIAWTLVFLIGRGLFMLYHTNLSNELSIPEMMLVFVHGIRMDFSMAGYFSLLPGLLFSAGFFLNGRKLVAHLAWLPRFYFIYSDFYYRPRFRTVYTLGLPVGCNAHLCTWARKQHRQGIFGKQFYYFVIG